MSKGIDPETGCGCLMLTFALLWLILLLGACAWIWRGVLGG